MTEDVPAYIEREKHAVFDIFMKMKNAGLSIKKDSPLYEQWVELMGEE